MTAAERRVELMRILEVGKKETMDKLAEELGVSRRTIQNDLIELSRFYPIEFVRGHDGGVMLPEWYHPYRSSLSKKQVELLRRLAPTLGEEDRKVVLSILSQFSPKI